MPVETRLGNSEVPTFAPLGDRAVMITLGSAIDVETHQRVRGVVSRLATQRIAGVIESVAAYASVVVHYDPLRVASGAAGASPYAQLVASLRAELSALGSFAPAPGQFVEIPVQYGGAGGPDLEEVAVRHRMTADEVIRRHSSVEYLVYMVGFVPGFAYLGGLPAELATPRRSEPRTHVPEGTVGIGGSQTGVYPMVSPGGWNLIGRTAARMFDPQREPASLLRAGDRVRFRAVSDIGANEDNP